MGYFKDQQIQAANDDPAMTARRVRGKRSRQRGNSYEREVAAALNGMRVGQFGTKIDVQSGDGTIVAQTKVGKSFPERLWNWLTQVPAKGDQIRILVMGDSPGPGTRRRSIVIMSLDEFVAHFTKGDGDERNGV